MLHLKDLSKQYGSKTLFEGAEANLTHRSRVALIGPNGSGKSTLIKIILGHEHADSGKVTRARHLAIGHLAQEVPKIAGRSVLAEAMRLDGRRDELVETRRELETQFEKTADASPEDLERYGRVLEELEQLDESRLEARAKEILMGMGFKLTDFNRSLTEFSGGWLMRVALARLLVSEPDLLLLDEPTNHLDLESLLWLEEFLAEYKGALLLVSHDRAFLNRMVNEVWEIDQRKVTSYRGNLDAFAAQKAERLAVLRSQYAGQQARIADLERFIERFGAKATKARQAQSRQKELDRMEKIEAPDEKRASVRFRFPPAPHGGKETVTMKRASFAYGDKTVFRDLDWVIRRGSRVAIVGVNGAGKTTLLKLLSGAMAPASGELKLGHEVRVGYYAQLQAETLRLDRTILDELWDERPDMEMAQVRAIAGAFLFSGDLVEKKIGVLSGGEKARVALAKLLLTPSNFLLLDEPTNHLDVESRGVLLDALQDYEGTLVLVSHDREFVGPLVDSVLEIEPQPGGAKVTPLLGAYDDYLARKVREMAQSFQQSKQGAKPAKAASLEPEKPKGPSNNQKKAWERERDKAEAEITKLEGKRAEVAEKLGDPAVYSDKAKALALMEEQKTVEQQLNERLARWEELCTLLG